MNQGPDHHAMAALRSNASGGGDQDGGGGGGGDGDGSNHLTLEGVDTTIGSNALDAPMLDGVANKKLFKKSLNGNLMTSLNGRNGDKINALKGLQSANVNAAAGQKLGGPGIGAIQAPPNHATFGKTERAM